MSDRQEQLITPPEHDLDDVWRALSVIRAPLITVEFDLHALLQSALDEAGIMYAREYVLGPRNRIDFLVSGGIGIEAKKGAPNGTRLLSQLERYCSFEAVKAMIVVTPWSRHLRLPEEIDGKPIRVMSLNKLWGVAL